jgi:hypothetical protein
VNSELFVCEDVNWALVHKAIYRYDDWMSSYRGTFEAVANCAVVVYMGKITIFTDVYNKLIIETRSCKLTLMGLHKMNALLNIRLELRR